MTDASPLSPQSASAPAEINAKRDEYSAVMTTEYEATADQRVLGIGNCIPLVFCRHQNNYGGAWVTPPAGRFGAVINPRDGDSFAFGLVISDGKIGSVAIGDIYKGPLKLSVLREAAAVFAYGNMPESGFNYQLQNLTPGAVIPGDPGDPGTPGTPGTPDRWDVRRETFTQCFTLGYPNPPGEGRISRSSISRAHITFRNNGSAGASTQVRVRVDGREQFNKVIDPAQTLTYSGSFAPATLLIIVGEPSIAAQICVDCDIDVSTFVAGTPGTPGTPPRPPTPDITLPDVVSTLPLYPGAGGDYQGMSCLAVKGRYGVDSTSQTYKHQVRCFVRSGIEVERLINRDIAPSDLFPDLAYYLLSKTVKTETALIDKDSFALAARFNNANNLLFNGVLANSVNLRDYLNRVSGFFMLGFVQQEGKYMLKPLLPLTADYRLSPFGVPIAATFDKANIVLGTYSRSYVDKSKRAPFCALMTWRSQHEALFGVNKSTEVRYANTAEDGPYEQYDMQEFCTTQDHAVLIGKYILAVRKHATHTVSFQATSAVAKLGPLDLISIKWGTETSQGVILDHEDTYQVDTVTQGPDGTVSIEATHFPVNVDKQSLVALDVLNGQYTIK
jgi:hypothetical protein